MKLSYGETKVLLPGVSVHGAPLAGRRIFSVLAGACKFGTVWAILFLFLPNNHHQITGYPPPRAP